jgi:hypothetical protein
VGAQGEELNLHLRRGVKEFDVKVIPDKASDGGGRIGVQVRARDSFVATRTKRFRRPKGVNGLKILSSTRLLVQTNLPTRHQPSCRRLQHGIWVWHGAENQSPLNGGRRLHFRGVHVVFGTVFEGLGTVVSHPNSLVVRLACNSHPPNHCAGGSRVRIT